MEMLKDYEIFVRCHNNEYDIENGNDCTYSYRTAIVWAHKGYDIVKVNLCDYSLIATYTDSKQIEDEYMQKCLEVAEEDVYYQNFIE